MPARGATESTPATAPRTRRGASRCVSALRILAAALMLCLMFGVGGALAACPPGQLPRGPNRACMCNNGTGPGPGANGCFVLACQSGQTPLPLLSGQFQGCCAADTTLQGNICLAPLCEPSQIQLPNNTCYSIQGAGGGQGCVTPPWTITQVLNLIWYGIYTPPPNFCCPSNQTPAITIGPPVPGSPLGGNIAYTRSCCPVGEVPQIDGSCQPPPPFLPSDCAGGAPYNPRTGSCCPSGTSALSNSYQCCPQGTFARADGSCGFCPIADQELNSGNITCKRYCGADNEVPIWNVATGWGRRLSSMPIG